MTMLGLALTPGAAHREEGKELGKRRHSGWPDLIMVSRTLVSTPVRTRL